MSSPVQFSGPALNTVQIQKRRRRIVQWSRWSLFDISAWKESDRVLELTTPPAISALLNDLDNVTSFERQLVLPQAFVVVLGLAFADERVRVLVPFVVIWKETKREQKLDRLITLALCNQAQVKPQATSQKPIKQTLLFNSEMKQ